MKIFVTGASGWVGSAVVNDLLARGHQVVGLARSDEGAAALAKTGAEVLRGTLEDLECLRRGADGADGVIHTAFNHDFSKMADNSLADRRAIETLGSALEGSARPLLVTAGVALLTPGRIATEEDVAPPVSPGWPRASEAAAVAVAKRGVKISVVRLPPSVHGAGDHGFVPILVDLARRTGMSVYAGDGANRWTAVHRLDAARAYNLALEHGARAPHYHPVAEEAVPFRSIAEAISRGLKIPVVPKSPEEAAEHFGWFARFAMMDSPASAAQTRSSLGWEPREIGLIADIEQSGYCD